MKTKNRFFVDEDVRNMHAKKKDKFSKPSKEEFVLDKFGNSIRLGDYVQTTLKDGTILNECEVAEINSGNMLVLILEDKETTREVHSSKVVLLSI